MTKQLKATPMNTSLKWREQHTEAGDVKSLQRVVHVINDVNRLVSLRVLMELLDLKETMEILEKL